LFISEGYSHCEILVTVTVETHNFRLLKRSFLGFKAASQ